ncbi:MAG: hypothetical protein KA149_07530 [Chitinophagales bacterium]|nr:hypothetical protein [Chitinophagales bacterium]
MNGIVIYSSRYGATGLYAKWIGMAMKIPVKKVSEIQAGELASYNFIVLGSPIYMGKILLKDWLIENSNLLKQKKLLFFIVGAAAATEKEKTEQYFTDNIPDQLLSAGNHFYLQGKMIFKELSFTDKVFLKMGAWLAKTEQDKKTMLTDFSAVKEVNLSALLQAAGGLPKATC